MKPQTVWYDPPLKANLAITQIIHQRQRALKTLKGVVLLREVERLNQLQEDEMMRVTVSALTSPAN